MPWVSVCMCVACLMPPPSPNQSGYTFSPDLELDRHLHSSTKKLPSQQHNDDLRCVCFSYGYDFVCEKERKISLKHTNKHFSFLTHSEQTTSGNCALHERAATNNSIFFTKKSLLDYYHPSLHMPVPSKELFVAAQISCLTSAE